MASQIRTRVQALSIIGILVALIAFYAVDGRAQGRGGPLKQQLLGTWALTSVSLEQGGNTRKQFGSDPKGILILDPSGHFSVMTARSGLSKFASNNREKGTPEENQAIVQGSIAYFGRYSISEDDRVLTYHVEASTFPNWTGADQNRLVDLRGDELRITTPTPAVGAGTVTTVYRRVK